MRLKNIINERPPVWVLVLLALLLWGGEFARRGLWEPDEARYTYVAQEMRDGGHWFVPHINGQPYPDKPPLMFWLINASSVATGGHITRLSARLPSLLGSILSLWVVTRLLGRWHSTQAAWRAALILMTSFFFWQTGGWAKIDALLCGLVMMSIYFFFRYNDSPQPWRLVAAYLLAGLAVLAKGPVGLAVPMGVYAAGTLAAGNGKALRRSHWLWGTALAVALPGIWLFLAWRDGAPPEYFRAMFGAKSFGRVIASKGHAQPIFYFLWHFPVEFLPWTIFLPATIVALSDRTLKRRLLAWGGFVIVLFSLFVCKRSIYILAAYPAAAMLIGAGWDDLSHLSRRWRRASGLCAIGLVCLLATAMTVALFLPQVPFNHLLLVPSAAVLIFGAKHLIALFRREELSNRWLFSLCGVLFLFQATASAIILPAINSMKGPIEAAAMVKERLPPGQPVYLYQQQLAIFPLYAERPGRELQSPEELKTVMRENTAGIVIFHREQWDVLPDGFKAALTPHEFKMGHKRLLWAEFPARTPSAETAP